MNKNVVVSMIVIFACTHLLSMESSRRPLILTTSDGFTLTSQIEILNRYSPQLETLTTLNLNVPFSRNELAVLCMLLSQYERTHDTEQLRQLLASFFEESSFPLTQENIWFRMIDYFRIVVLKEVLVELIANKIFDGIDSYLDHQNSPHAAWNEFVTSVRRRGAELSGDHQQRKDNQGVPALSEQNALLFNMQPLPIKSAVVLIQNIQRQRQTLPNNCIMTSISFDSSQMKCLGWYDNNTIICDDMSHAKAHNIITGEAEVIYAGQHESMSGALSYDGKYIFFIQVGRPGVISAQDRSVRQLDMHYNGTEVEIDSAGAFLRNYWSPCNRYCALVHLNELIMWDIQTGHIVLKDAPLRGTLLIDRVHWSADSKYLYISSTAGKEPLMWDISSGLAMNQINQVRIDTVQQGITSLGLPAELTEYSVFSPDKQLIACKSKEQGCDVCSVKIFSVVDTELICSYTHYGDINLIQWNNTGDFLLIADQSSVDIYNRPLPREREQEISRWRHTQGKIKMVIIPGAQAVAWEANADRFVVSSGSKLSIYDNSPRLRLEETIHANLPITAFDVSDQGLVYGTDNGCFIRNAQRGSATEHISLFEDNVQVIACAPLSVPYRAFINSGDHSFILWKDDLATDNIIGTGVLSSVSWKNSSSSGSGIEPVHDEAMIWQYDFGTFVTGSVHGETTIWQRDFGDNDFMSWQKYFSFDPEKLIRTFRGGIAAVNAVAWSPDGKSIASACADGKIYIWSVLSKSHRYTAKVPKKDEDSPSPVTSLVWQDKYLISGSQDGTICIWDVESNTLLSKVNLVKSKIRSLSYGSNGDLAIVHENGLVCIGRIQFLLENFRRFGS